jgi:hypothetical protein
LIRVERGHLCGLWIDRLPGFYVLQPFNDYPVGRVQPLIDHPIRPDSIARLYGPERNFIVWAY